MPPWITCFLNEWIYYFNKRLHNFCCNPHIWHEYFEVRFFIIGSSELRITLHHNSRLNCVWNGISPPSCRPDLVLLLLIDTWRDRSSFVLKCIASGHNKTNIVKADFSKTARQNFILFSQPIENNFSFAMMIVRHRAALNYVLAQWMNIILQQETPQFLLQPAYMTRIFWSKVFHNRLVKIENNFAP